MYEWDEQTKSVTFSHNPFSMPQGGLEALEGKDPLEILAFQYDIVCNGVELSSGAIRNHRPDIMVKAFALAGYGQDVLEERFGGMFRALHYGAPPHGGIAPGIDRIVMLIADQPNLREVTAFPLNQQAQELVLGAPSPVDDKQLKELNLQLSLAARERLREEREQPAASAPITWSRRTPVEARRIGAGLKRSDGGRESRARWRRSADRSGSGWSPQAGAFSLFLS